MKRLWLVAVLLAGCKPSDDAGGDDEPPAGPVAVVCTAARESPVTEHTTLRGVVRAAPDKDAVVSSAVSGRITSVSVSEGQHVDANAEVARVEDPALPAAIAQADVAIRSAKGKVQAAGRVLARARRLLAEGIAAKREVEDAEAALALAAGDLADAKARRDLAVTEQARAVVRSPIAGTVVKLMKHAGELVDGTPATPIVEIAVPDALELQADAPAAVLVRLEEHTVVTVRLDALPGVDIPGHVVFVSPSADPATSLGAVRAALDPPRTLAARLKFGLAGEVAIDVATSRAIVVPSVAVRRSPEGEEQVVVCDHGKASVRVVVVATRRDGEVVLRSGLTAGEKVVTDHVLGLEDGTDLVPPGKRE